MTQTTTPPMSTLEKVAMIASGLILLSSLLYWVQQINFVREVLKLAAGAGV